MIVKQFPDRGGKVLWVVGNHIIALIRGLDALVSERCDHRRASERALDEAHDLWSIVDHLRTFRFRIVFMILMKLMVKST